MLEPSGGKCRRGSHELSGGAQRCALGDWKVHGGGFPTEALMSTEEKIQAIRDNRAASLVAMLEESYDEGDPLDILKIRETLDIIAAADMALKKL